MTRTDIEYLLTPRRGYPSSDDVKWAADLAFRRGIAVECAYDDVFCAKPLKKTIYVTPLFGDVELAAFCHEVAHCEDDHRDGRRVLVREALGHEFHDSMKSELVAWRGAMQMLGRRWTAAMAKHMEWCLWSYAYQPGQILTTAEFLEFEAVIDEGHELARHRIRLLPQGVRR